MIAKLILVAVVAMAAITPASGQEVLESARSLSMEQYDGWTYGPDSSKKQIDCVQFVLAVVEKKAGKLRDVGRTRILISDLTEDAIKKDDYRLLREADARTKGVQQALVDAGKGEVVKPKDVKPGDFVQYWIKKSDGSWLGHAAIIETVRSNNKGQVLAKLYGAHESLGRIGTSQYELDLTGPNRMMYLVRLK